MKVEGVCAQTIPFISIGRQGRVIKENVRDEKPWKYHLGQGISALESEFTSNPSPMVSQLSEPQFIYTSLQRGADSANWVNTYLKRLS